MNDGGQEDGPLDLYQVYAAFGLRPPPELAHLSFAAANEHRPSPAPRPATLDLPGSTWTPQNGGVDVDQAEPEGPRPVSAFPGDEWLQFPDTAVPAAAFPASARLSPVKVPTGPVRSEDSGQAISHLRADILREAARFFAALSDIMAGSQPDVLHAALDPQMSSLIRAAHQVCSNIARDSTQSRRVGSPSRRKAARVQRSSVSSEGDEESGVPAGASGRTGSVSAPSDVPQTPGSCGSVLPSPVILPFELPTDFVRGPWRKVEVERLRALYDASSRKLNRGAGKSDQATAHGAVQAAQRRPSVDWEWVVEQFGTTRSKHQILLQAVRMGLKATTTKPGRRAGQRSFRQKEAFMLDDLNNGGASSDSG